MMAGRGRGRGRGALDFDAIRKTPRPGVTPLENDGPLSEFALMINSVDVKATSVKAVIQCASKALTSDASNESMVRVLKLLVARCNDDWHFAYQAAVISQGLIRQDAIGKEFRKHLLQIMQNNFEEKETLRDESVFKFVGSMSFLCQMLAVLRSDGGDPFRPLIRPVITVIALMLEDTASDIEMECGVYQVRAVMPAIYMCETPDAEGYHSLIVIIRTHLLDSRGSRKLREDMLDVIEENASHYSLSKAKRC